MRDTEDGAIQILRTHYLFADLSGAQYTRLLPNIQCSAFSAGQHLFHQDDKAASFFLLDSGTVKLYRVSNEGQEKVMKLVHAGQSFAESVMFMDLPRYPVHAQGVRPGVLVSIGAAAYLDIMQTSFATCRTVFARLTERIQAHWDEIEALSLRNSRYRVVHYLLSLASQRDRDAITVTLPNSKTLIAAKLAVTPETLSRILRGLHEEDLIDMQGYRLHIPNLAALREQLMA